jgi:hypothetical protein
MPKKTKINCPKCGHPLLHIRFWNENVFGKGKKNPYVGWICRNEKCHGWYCDYCQEWHPYGTACATAMVRNVRGENHRWQTTDPDWKHRDKDLNAS